MTRRTSSINRGGDDECQHVVPWNGGKPGTSLISKVRLPMKPQCELKAAWNGEQLIVTAHLVPRYAFMTASIDISLEGTPILKTGGVLKFVGGHVAGFERNGRLHSVEASWGKAAPTYFPVKVAVDGQLVMEAPVRISNWWLVYWPWLILLGVLAWRLH